MQVFLVGGAVRDTLLGLPVAERDWVVVGATPADLLALGYRQVGRDFPVFLHPQTHDEYALARTERKSGPGHTGFVCHAGPDVTLEDDLRRRDLTINAIAQDSDGRLIDPYGGVADLRSRLLRHVSAAFVEDPLRLFRVARFAARLPGFAVAPETVALLQRMAAENQTAELSAERVWVELEKALASPAPERFLGLLAEIGALEPWFAEFLSVIPAAGDPPAPAYPVIPALAMAAALPANDTALRFAAICAALSPAAVTALCGRLRAPRRFQRLAEIVARHGVVLARWQAVPADALLEAFTAIGAFAGDRAPGDVLRVVAAVHGDPSPGLEQLIAATAAIRAADFGDRGLSGKALGQAIQDAREACIIGWPSRISD